MGHPSGRPELSIGAAAARRGRGAGRALLRAPASQARATGTGRISLSVGRANHAHGPYLKEGYRIVDSGDANSDTMIKDPERRSRDGRVRDGATACARA